MTVWLVAALSLFEIQAFEDSDTDEKLKRQFSRLLTVCHCLQVATGACSWSPAATCIKMDSYCWSLSQSQIFSGNKSTSEFLKPLFVNWLFTAYNSFGLIVCEGKCLDKYVRLCCVSGFFENCVFLLCFAAQLGRCVWLFTLVPYGYF